MLNKENKFNNHGTMKKTHDFMKSVCDEHKQGANSISLENRSSFDRHFGRLFDAEPNQVSDATLITLGNDHMRDDPTDESGFSDIPVGLAFLGQFIDHDLTLDITTTLAESIEEPSEIENFRSPRLELDSIYGSGPEASPYLYGIEEEKFKLIFGDEGGNPLDLPRNRNGTAIIGDPRNDENIILSQIHGRQFIDLHNKTFDFLVSNGGVSNSDKETFERAREIIIGLYHSRIIKDFLPAVVDNEVLDPLLEGFRDGALPEDNIRWSEAPDMPVEFSAAAYRFGHSMIREDYQLNGEDKAVIELFDIGGFDRVPRFFNLDFDFFFSNPDRNPLMARKIDTKITPSLLDLPKRIAENPSNLAVRNLIRGKVFQLPSGETIANDHFNGNQIETPNPITALQLEGQTPLWFYILAEAEQNDGKLGTVGGNIVAGTILNVILRQQKRKRNKGISASVLVAKNLLQESSPIKAAFKAIES